MENRFNMFAGAFVKDLREAGTYRHNNNCNPWSNNSDALAKWREILKQYEDLFFYPKINRTLLQMKLRLPESFEKPEIFACGMQMARPEGFEPPACRFVV